MTPSIVALAAAYALGLAPVIDGQIVTGPVIVFLGAPGSGKSTQAALAADYLKLPVISVADLIRDNAAEFQKIRTRGITGIEPETDPLLNKLFEERIKRGDVANGMILDGYPNTKDHADFASKLVGSGVIPKAIVINLQVPDDVVRKRLAGKGGQLSNSVEQRLKDYHRETNAIEIYFPNADITNIDGTKKPNAVAKKIKAVLKRKLNK